MDARAESDKDNKYGGLVRRRRGLTSASMRSIIQQFDQQGTQRGVNGES